MMAPPVQYNKAIQLPDKQGTAMIRSALQTRDFSVRRLALSAAEDAQIQRAVPIEAPVAIEICGVSYAVMMATPSDLLDYARGFVLSEGLADRSDPLDEIGIHEVGGGWIIRIQLPPEKAAAAVRRIRKRTAESSCGLCGMANIDEILRPLPPIATRIATSRSAIARALSSLGDHQPLSRETGAAHAAAFCAPDGRIVCVREDVGRHNALDKLIGALMSAGIEAASGFVLLTARCSYELVEKTVRAGCPLLVTISAPTSLAVERAIDAGLSLVTLARPDSAIVVCDTLKNIA
jgi:FdhD protein